jgi:hypothetical protein
LVVSRACNFRSSLLTCNNADSRLLANVNIKVAGVGNQIAIIPLPSFAPGAPGAPE